MSTAAPEDRDLATLIDSDAGKAFLDGAFGWYGLALVMFLFNTVLGEELLFRGFLLPRMNGAFGRRDWVANGLLFAGYHLHVPWAIPEHGCLRERPGRFSGARREHRRPRAHRQPRPQVDENPAFAGLPEVRPRGLEPPRAIRPTRPSTLRVYQFRHRRVVAKV